MDPVAQAMQGIASVESKGWKNPYAAKGVVVKTGAYAGDRAYGKYQVMGKNVPNWTREVLGRSMTPAQFLINPQAQEAVARFKIGQIYKEFGNIADTASVWFSGRPVAQAGNAVDANGTTVSRYIAGVMKGLGSDTSQNLASAAIAAGSAGEKISSGIRGLLQNLMGTNPELSYTAPLTKSVAPKSLPSIASVPWKSLTVSPSTTAVPPSSFLTNLFQNLTGTNPQLQYQNPFSVSLLNPAPVANAAPLPVPNIQQPIGTVTTPFGGSTTQESFHPGVDIAAPNGTPFPSTTKGIVTGSDMGHEQGENNFGNSLIITDPQGNQHRYSHMQKGYVQVGQPVTTGQTIGSIGDTGATYSPSKGDASNLDYRVVNAHGRMKNPMTYMKNFL